MGIYQKLYIAFMSLLVLILVFFNYSYAMYDSTHEELGVVKIGLATLEPLIESPSFNEEKEILVEANTTKEVTITLTNVYEIDIKANLYYSSTTNTTDQEVFYKGVATPTKEGVIVPKYGDEGHTITYTVTIENTSSNSQTYSFYSKGGFTYNELEFPIDPIYKIITEVPNFMITGEEFNDIFVEIVNPGYFNTYKMKYNFSSVEFEEGVNPNYETYPNHFDLSKFQNKTVIGYIDGEVLRIQSNKKIYANPDSGKMFLGFNVTEINFYNNFNTSEVTNMGGMFRKSNISNLDLTSFDTSKVKTMAQMFRVSTVSSLNLTSFDTSNVRNMYAMFEVCTATSIDLSSFDTSSVTDMSSMFYRSLATNLDLSSFDTSSVTDMNYMLSGSAATTLYARTAVDKEKFDASSDKPAELAVIVKDYILTESFFSTFNYPSSTLPPKFTLKNGMVFTSIAFEKNIDSNYESYNYFDLSKEQNKKIIGYIDSGVLKIQSNETIYIESNSFSCPVINGNTICTSNTFSWFLGVKNIEFNNMVDISNLRSMRGMFYSSTIDILDISSFDTYNVTDVNQLFQNSSIKTVYVKDAATKTKFNASSGKPAELTVIVGTP